MEHRWWNKGTEMTEEQNNDGIVEQCKKGGGTIIPEQ